MPPPTTTPPRVVQVDVKGPASADSADMLLGLAIQGAGILRLSEHVVADAIQKGQLEPLLQDAQDPEKYPLWALLPPGRHRAPKVKAFLDFLIERLGSVPWRTGSGANQDRKPRRAEHNASRKGRLPKHSVPHQIHELGRRHHVGV